MSYIWMRLFVCEMKLVTLLLFMVVTRDTCAKQDDHSSVHGRILTSPQFKNGSSLTNLRSLSKGFSSVGGSASGSSADRPLVLTDEWSQDGDDDGACNWDGGACTWQGDADGFQVTTGRQLVERMRKEPGSVSGPLADMRGDSNGDFLYVGGSSSGAEAHRQIFSPRMKPPTFGTCKIQFNIHANNIKDGAVGLFYETLPHKHVVDIATAHDAAIDSWKTMTLRVGAMKNQFRLMLEIWTSDVFPFHAALDDIKFVNCFPPKPKPTIFNISCSDDQSFECQPGQCISKAAVCDINVDCDNGLDEGEICEEVIKWNAYCNFESGSCGWRNVSDNDIWWVVKKADKSLLDNTFNNESGHFMYLNLLRNNKMGHRGGLRSTIFPPPPKNHSNPNSSDYLSCQVRFNYRMFGDRPGDLALYVMELFPGKAVENVSLWSFEYRKKSRKWQRATIELPPITHRYYLQFVSRQGMSHLYNITIDDFSLSPQCFTPGHKFTTCGAVGSRGPTQSQCDLSYKSSGLKVRVNDDGILSGIQKWTVPESGVYSVTAKGSGGGQGLRNIRPSRGDVVYGVFNWTQGEEIYILVGQKGGDACSPEARISPQIGRLCEAVKMENKRRKRKVSVLTMKLQPTNNLTMGGGGGGGGGATYIFKKNESSGTFIPLIISSGGGGLGAIIMEGAINPDGRGFDQSLTGTNGRSSSNGTGAGGGWNDTNKQSIHSGWSLAVGGFGGKACKESDGWLTSGGFGGGGGGCSAGGGGGGYNGGDASMNDSIGDNGAGGYSYNASTQVRTTLPVTVTSSRSTADGSVNILPAFIGCGCEYQCVIFDVEGVLHSCICPADQTLSDDERTCQALGALPTTSETSKITQHLMTILPVALIVVLAISTAMFLLYHRYRRQMALQAQRQDCPYVRDSSELQLNRLRQNAAGRVTEYNPNYEFGGSMCTIQDLKDVNRENLTLVKALGQGAFGEVYQGYLSNVPGEITDIPVAIKTLPELSSDQAEMDFLMEALIMSKFSNPNIVKFIGVCFEKLPKFIVLELLTGGDLKSFLRESRRKPEKPSSLSMRDLLMMAMDVAKGCQYLEDNHFIHRDIAARNCLLTSRDVTRVVKIADFGMARDIYRADYYRKGGKAMLPVKWMPPEAFMDGIFTSKTDVWSFGVLLWEVMSLGFMPYPGRGNQEVMQLVTSGGRLEPPPNCPGPVHQIMIQCWNSVPDERPNFSTILERLGYCLQDPHVTSAPLPVFHRPPSTERDTTIMRPPDSDVCLQVHRSDIKEPQSPSSNDYLVPIPSNYSLCTEKTELQSASSLESVDRILEMEPDHGGKAGGGGGGRLCEEGASCRDPLVMPSPLKPNFAGSNNWETSFSKDKSHLSSLPWGGSGGYQSVPTQDMDSIGSMGGGGGAVARVPLATIPPPECSPARKSPPSAIARQRPNYAKKSSGATPELALDASSLQKQTSPPPSYPTQVVSYANVAVSNSEPVRTTSYIYGGSSKDVKC